MTSASSAATRMTSSSGCRRWRVRPRPFARLSDWAVSERRLRGLEDVTARGAKLPAARRTRAAGRCRHRRRVGQLGAVPSRDEAGRRLSSFTHHWTGSRLKHAGGSGDVADSSLSQPCGGWDSSGYWRLAYASHCKASTGPAEEGCPRLADRHHGFDHGGVDHLCAACVLGLIVCGSWVVMAERDPAIGLAIRKLGRALDSSSR